jgi:hypothetical protein
MMERGKLDRDSLRAVGVPKLLVDEFVELDALGLDPPTPTEELVRSTLERCEEALKEFRPKVKVTPSPFPPEIESVLVPALAELLGALNTCVAARAVSFAFQNPKEPALILVDNHDVIDPELWGSNPSLQMLDGTFRGVDHAIEDITGKPFDRLIVLKEDVDRYDDRDLQEIRRTIELPTSKETYLVAAKDAGPFREYGYAVVAKEMVFEFEKADQPNSIGVKAPEGVRDPGKAMEVQLNFSELKQKAFPVYVNNTLNLKLAEALKTPSNEPLLMVLRDISQG